MNKETKLQVEAIKNGTVIDHIPANLGIKIAQMFHIPQTNQRVTIGLNLPSSALGKKDLIKIENVFITEDQANQLAIYAPHATVNQIDDYVVVKKLNLALPQSITGIFHCPNSNCITHNEPVKTRFSVIQKGEMVKLKCGYCEKSFSQAIMISQD